jgi:sugar phosphate isomerase/epimerase
MKRREFLTQSMGMVGAGAAWPRANGHAGHAQVAGGTTTPASAVRLGGPIFTETSDPVEMARAHRLLGYRAAYCPKASAKDAAAVKAIADAFRGEDVVIAEVGRWVNLLDADPAKRHANLETVTEGLALAEAVGALCCVDIAGSFNPDVWYGPHPDNLSERFFDAAVENARRIIDAVKPTRAKFCYEMMGWSIPDSPASFLRLLKAVDRPAFGVHLDPCNLVNGPARFYRNTDLLNECFDTLGPWIVSCHAKDLTWDVEMNMHFREVHPGAGSLDYTTYLRRLAALPQQPPLMLEHMPNAEEYSKGRLYLFDLGRRIGVDVGSAEEGAGAPR